MSKLLRLEGGHLSFYCPGCKCHHYFDSRWTFDGNMEAPTFSPSLLVQTPDPNHAGQDITRCHSFVRAGMIEFLSDCTHELASKTAPMVDVE